MQLIGQFYTHLRFPLFKFQLSVSFRRLGPAESTRRSHWGSSTCRLCPLWSCNLTLLFIRLPLLLCFNVFSVTSKSGCLAPKILQSVHCTAVVPQIQTVKVHILQTELGRSGGAAESLRDAEARAAAKTRGWRNVFTVVFLSVFYLVRLSERDITANDITIS